MGLKYVKSMKDIEKGGGLKTVETCRNSELLKRGVITIKL